MQQSLFIVFYSNLLFQIGDMEKVNVEYRPDCGGTTTWSHKALAGRIGMGKKKVLDSVDALPDN